MTGFGICYSSHTYIHDNSSDLNKDFQEETGNSSTGVDL